nr:unnamed protein product [Callosobruchus analis]
MSNVTKIEYRAVIKFLTKKGIASNIIKDGIYGRSSPSYSVVKESAKWFRMGQEYLEDEERTGQPMEVITEDKVALVEELVLSDPCFEGGKSNLALSVQNITKKSIDARGRLGNIARLQGLVLAGDLPPKIRQTACEIYLLCINLQGSRLIKHGHNPKKETQASLKDKNKPVRRHPTTSHEERLWFPVVRRKKK